MDTEFTTLEIILGLYATSMTLIIGLLVYFTAREKNRELAKDIRSIKTHCESIEKSQAELSTETKATNGKVVALFENTERKIDSLRAETASAHQQIGTNIEPLRTATK